MAPHEKITNAIRNARRQGRPALVGYLTAGFPTKERFAAYLKSVSAVADVMEIGIPFSDPVADGPTIQRSSRVALEHNTSLRWTLDFLAGQSPAANCPILLMSYLNPLLAFGLDKLPRVALEAGVSGFIVPDLPYEECAELKATLEDQGLALVQLVTPVTPDDRLKVLCQASRGFVYAVTMTGTTGKNVAVHKDFLDYLDRVRKSGPLPAVAGFGIRSAEQVRLMSDHVDGVVVASALVEIIERGEDPAKFLQSLRG